MATDQRLEDWRLATMLASSSFSAKYLLVGFLDSGKRFTKKLIRVEENPRPGGKYCHILNNFLDKFFGC